LFDYFDYNLFGIKLRSECSVRGQTAGNEVARAYGAYNYYYTHIMKWDFSLFPTREHKQNVVLQTSKTYICELECSPFLRTKSSTVG
jgi:hypothetical protein